MNANLAFAAHFGNGQKSNLLNGLIDQYVDFDDPSFEGITGLKPVEENPLFSTFHSAMVSEEPIDTDFCSIEKLGLGAQIIDLIDEIGIEDARKQVNGLDCVIEAIKEDFAFGLIKYQAEANLSQDDEGIDNQKIFKILFARITSVSFIKVESIINTASEYAPGLFDLT
jgi:hypothetical protein